MTNDRILRLQTHDDGVNAWQTARVAPPSSLADRIYGYSDYRERTRGFTTRRELPHAEGVLIVNLGSPIAITGGNGAEIRLGHGDAFIAGVHLRPALSHASGDQAGMHVFLPLATLRQLLATPMDRFVDQVVPLDALLGPAARELGARLCDAPDRATRIALLDAALGRRLCDATPLGGRQARALHLLRHRPHDDIADIASQLGWSRKHLADRVRDAVGVGPRSFRRLLRFQSLVAAIDAAPATPDWAGLAHDAGYCDQPHMIRAFREFSGLTPSAYRTRTLPDGGGLPEP